MTPQDLFRKRLRELRETRGWSQARLAQEVNKLGGVITQTTVTRLERGPRQVTLDELLSLAAGLQVSPLVLMLPEDAVTEVRVGSKTLTPAQMAGWFMAASNRPPGGPSTKGMEAMPAALVESWITQTPTMLGVMSELEEDGSDKQQLLLDAAARAEWRIRKDFRPITKPKPARKAAGRG